MPKVIADAKEKILAAAKPALFLHGYNGLALRDLAKQCNMAVGTLYNYFPSKETLVAAIMVEDWLVQLAAMQAACETAQTVHQGVQALYQGIEAFSAPYQPIWEQYGGSTIGFGERHLMLRNQLAQMLAALCQRLGQPATPAFCALLAETTLSAARQPDIDQDTLTEMVSRLFA